MPIFEYRAIICLITFMPMAEYTREIKILLLPYIIELFKNPSSFVGTEKDLNNFATLVELTMLRMDEKCISKVILPTIASSIEKITDFGTLQNLLISQLWEVCTFRKANRLLYMYGSELSMGLDQGYLSSSYYRSY